MFTKGMLVENLARPEWGPGKIVHVSGGSLHVIFRDLEENMARIFHADAPALRIAQHQSDPTLDNLPPLIVKDGRWVLPTNRLTLQSAIQRFLHEFPAGFADGRYMEQERDYKLAAHLEFQKELGIQQIRSLVANRDSEGLAKKVLRVLGRVNLLSAFESAAFHDAMYTDGAVIPFFTELLKILDAKQLSRQILDEYLDAVISLPQPRGKVASWPVATVFPYLAQPATFMFLKPEVTKAAAESLGFDLKYNSTLNSATYDALQRMGALYWGLLRPLGARDFVDVQSFIWVTCGGYDLQPAASKSAKNQ